MSTLKILSSGYNMATQKSLKHIKYFFIGIAEFSS